MTRKATINEVVDYLRRLTNADNEGAILIGANPGPRGKTSLTYTDENGKRSEFVISLAHADA